MVATTFLFITAWGLLRRRSLATAATQCFLDTKYVWSTPTSVGRHLFAQVWQGSNQKESPFKKDEMQTSTSNWGSGDKMERIEGSSFLFQTVGLFSASPATQKGRAPFSSLGYKKNKMPNYRQCFSKIRANAAEEAGMSLQFYCWPLCVFEHFCRCLCYSIQLHLT